MSSNTVLMTILLSSFSVLQAMSMGIPAIVTGWSGTADFVDSSVGYPINYTLSKVGSFTTQLVSPMGSLFVGLSSALNLMQCEYNHPHYSAQVPEGEPWWFKGAQWADADVLHLRKVRVGEEVDQSR